MNCGAAALGMAGMMGATIPLSSPVPVEGSGGGVSCSDSPGGTGLVPVAIGGGGVTGMGTELGDVAPG